MPRRSGRCARFILRTFSGGRIGQHVVHARHPMRRLSIGPENTSPICVRMQKVSGTLITSARRSSGLSRPAKAPCTFPYLQNGLVGYHRSRQQAGFGSRRINRADRQIVAPPKALVISGNTTSRRYFLASQAAIMPVSPRPSLEVQTSGTLCLNLVITCHLDGT